MASNEWGTPPDLVNALDVDYGPFVLDPAAADWNHKTGTYFTKEQDGLSRDWHATASELGGSVWLNPPHDRPEPWMQKAVATAEAGTTVVALVRASISVGWWHRVVMPNAAEVLAVDGRIRFVPKTGTAGTAAFESAVVVFRPDASGPPLFGSVSRHGGDIEVVRCTCTARAA